jgi:fluoride ion exporter CrcB/FEX
LKDGRFLSAGLNIALSVVLCILGVCIGIVLAQRIA